MKSDVSPMFLTYFMVDWGKVRQEKSSQKCQTCGMPLMKTEDLTDNKGIRYEGYVCHMDKQVTWVRAT